MKLFLIINILMVIINLSLANDNEEWISYKRSFSKGYRNKVEDQKRFELWKKASNLINKHNMLAKKGRVSYWMEHNSIADLSEEEFKSTKLGFKMSKENVPKELGSLKPLFKQGQSVTLPDSIDWRKLGLVTSVKNQGTCGSCWSFAAIGALEGQSIKSNKTFTTTPLATQQLLDCDSKSYGCNGGDFANGLRYARDFNGVVTDSNYPYLGYKRTCKYNSKTVVYDPMSFVLIYNENDLKYAIATQGPVAFAMHSSAPSFRYYRRGIYDDKLYCYSNRALDHAMLVVGYGSENGTDFWIVKNSWGPFWGENGYIRVKRGSKTCGIGTYAGYPVS